MIDHGIEVQTVRTGTATGQVNIPGAVDGALGDDACRSLTTVKHGRACGIALKPDSRPIVRVQRHGAGRTVTQHHGVGGPHRWHNPLNQALTAVTGQTGARADIHATTSGSAVGVTSDHVHRVGTDRTRKQHTPLIGRIGHAKDVEVAGSAQAAAVREVNATYTRFSTSGAGGDNSCVGIHRTARVVDGDVARNNGCGTEVAWQLVV